MFFSHLQPLLKKGITFNFSIEPSDDGLIAVTVVPQNAKAGSHGLVPRIFTATPAELDAEFGDLMKGYSVMTKTLAEQLEDAGLVMEASGAEASKAAATQASSKPKQRSASTPAKAASAPAGLLSDDASDQTDKDETDLGTDSDTPPVQPPPPSSPAMTTMDLGFTL